MEPGTAFVAASVARVTLRPPAIAYAVRGSDRAGVLRAIAYAGTEWGGIGQPIITVGRGARLRSLDREVLKIVRPEAIIDYALLSEQEASRLTALSGARVIPERTLDCDEPGAAAGATVDPASLRARTLFVASDGAPLVEKAALGVLLQAQDVYWRSTGVAVAERESHLELLEGQLDAPSPLSMTRRDYAAYETESFYAPIVVYAAVGLSIARVNYFWNVRALGAPNGLPVVWLPPAALYDATVAARLRTLVLGRPIQVQPDVLLSGPDDAELRRSGAALGLVEWDPTTAPRRINLDPRRPRDLEREPLSFAVNLSPVPFLIGQRTVGAPFSVPLTVARPRTTVDFPSPLSFHRPVGRITVGIDEEHFRWPRTPAVARLIHPEGRWTTYGLTMSYTIGPRYRIDLGVPEPSAVASALLAERGWAWTLSDKGRYAEALVASVERTRRPFLDETELVIVRALTSLSRKKAEQALRAVLRAGTAAASAAEAVMDMLPALVPRWRTAGEIASDVSRTSAEIRSVLVGLIDAGFVRRAYRFRCPKCGVQSTIPLERAANRVQCDGCGHRSVLRGPASEEPVFVYGISSLLDLAMDQDCLGHVHAAQWLTRTASLLWAVPGAELSHASAPAREIDVLGLSRTELVVSEVKNRTTGFSGREVQKAVEVAEAVGASTLALMSLERFPAGDRSAVERLARGYQGRLLIAGLDELVAS